MHFNKRLIDRLMKQHLFFDLDGTIIDSQKGIKAAFRYAFDKLNTVAPNDAILDTFIGPPLETSFSSLIIDKDLTEKAIAYFRDYYETTGYKEFTVYPHIVNQLVKLKEAGYQLSITTSKHEIMAQKMMEQVHLDNLFTLICGSLPDSYSKADVLKRAIDLSKTSRNHAIIIGDTKYDMIGGLSLGLHKIGVLWGYGPEEELIEYQADAIIKEPAQLFDAIQEFVND